MQGIMQDPPVFCTHAGTQVSLPHLHGIPCHLVEAAMGQLSY